MVQADFKGGNVSSDGGLLLLGKVDRRLKLFSQAAELFTDDRDQSKVIRNTRRIQAHFSGAHPAREIFEKVQRNLR